MRTTMKAAIAGAAALLLAGCAGAQLNTARGTQPAGTPFAQSLFSGYMGLAETEYAEYDYGDADFFGAKAIATTGEAEVLPEEINARKLPSDAVSELTDARARLIAVLDATARKKAAAVAARAQVMFDCWMQEQEENRQPDDIAKCRSDFYDALELAESIMAKKKKKAAPAKKAPAAMAVDFNTRNWVIYFGHNGKALDADAKADINAIIAHYKTGKGKKIKIRLGGHTDSSGTPEYNVGLALDRADEVALALIDAGVIANDIIIRGYGETDLAVATPEGQREAKNRRVEVEVGPK